MYYQRAQSLQPTYRRWLKNFAFWRKFLITKNSADSMLNHSKNSVCPQLTTNIMWAKIFFVQPEKSETKLIFCLNTVCHPYVTMVSKVTRNSRKKYIFRIKSPQKLYQNNTNNVHIPSTLSNVYQNIPPRTILKIFWSIFLWICASMCCFKSVECSISTLLKFIFLNVKFFVCEKFCSVVFVILFIFFNLVWTLYCY